MSLKELVCDEGIFKIRGEGKKVKPKQIEVGFVLTTGYSHSNEYYEELNNALNGKARTIGANAYMAGILGVSTIGCTTRGDEVDASAIPVVFYKI